MDSNEEKKSLSHIQELAKSSNISSKLCIEPESHLQSLGFTLNNGKARFKLDEDTPLCTLTNFCTDDSDDTLSFVVLGKDSLDSIQQSSVASYIDIQQKCMSIDYNSMIASWDTTELHQKLSELLQENVKLKETLKQNNIAMKQQFNNLASWQEEIMKVHQNHKKKFSETRELINYLKKENTELKVRLSTDLTSHVEMGYELLDTSDEQDVTKEEKKESVPTNELTKSALSELETILNEGTDDKDTESKETTIVDNELKMALNESIYEDTVSKQTTTFNGTISGKSIGNSDIEPKQTATDDTELKIIPTESINEDMATVQTSTPETIETTEKIMELDKLSKSILSKFASTLNETTDDKDAILRKTATYEVVQKIMKLDKFNQLSLRKLDTMLSENIDDKDAVTKQAMTSKTIQKIVETFSKLVLSELETLLNKDADGEDSVPKQNRIADAELKTLLNENTGGSAPGTMERMVESKKQNSDNERLLEKKRVALMKMKESVEEEKTVLNSREKNLEYKREYKDLKDAKDLLEQERISSKEKQTFLDEVSQLYEVYYEKMLQMERKMFEAKYSTMAKELSILHGRIETKESVIRELKKELAEHKENVSLLQTQLKVYEEDFNHEKRMKEILLNDKTSLDVDLQRQIEYNERLQQEINRISTSNNENNRSVLEAPYVLTYSCPVCQNIFSNMQSLETHISHCIELD